MYFTSSENSPGPVGPKLCVYNGLRDEQVLNQILPLKVPAKQEIEKDQEKLKLLFLSHERMSA